MQIYDVAVIGAGVVGSAVARELTRYNLKTLVLEKELDVATGNSSRAVEGNQEFDTVARELGVPFKRTGKLVIGFTDNDLANILKFKKIGEINGVKDIRMISKDEIQRIEPNAGGEFAMHVPASGILDPMAYTIALAENAAMNGAAFRFGCRVTAITRVSKDEAAALMKADDQGDSIPGDNAPLYKVGTSGGTFPADVLYRIETSGGTFLTKWVVNCAGAYAAIISEMLGYPKYYQRGFKGEYFVLDKKAGAFLKTPVYPAPNDKGGFSTHATPTVDGNILVGPDSYLTKDLEDYANIKE